MGCVLIRPGEAVAPFQEQAIPDAIATAVLFPGFGESLVQKLQHRVISAVIAALVLKPQRDDDPVFIGLFCKIHDFLQIAPMILGGIPLEAVDRDIDFVQTLWTSFAVIGISVISVLVYSYHLYRKSYNKQIQL